MRRHVSWLIPLVVGLIILVPTFFILSLKKETVEFVGLQNSAPAP